MNREGEMMKEVCLVFSKFQCIHYSIQIHRIVTICLGSPPDQITYEYYDIFKQYQKIGPISPMEFYKQFIKPVYDINDKVINS